MWRLKKLIILFNRRIFEEFLGLVTLVVSRKICYYVIVSIEIEISSFLESEISNFGFFISILHSMSRCFQCSFVWHLNVLLKLILAICIVSLIFYAVLVENLKV